MRIRLVLLLLGIAFAPSTAAQPTGGLLVKHGRVVDGTGVPGRVADVRIAGDAIAEVGQDLAPGSAERVIDAHGLTVVPGFIDMHSHADGGIGEAPEAT